MLTFDEVLRAREHRILKRLSRYRKYESQSVDLFEAEDHSIGKDEEILGVYENSPDDVRSNVVVTTRGLHFFSEGWKFLGYEQIASAKTPLDEEKDKTLADMLILQLQSGEEINVSILGGQGKTRDIWSFLRFVDRVVSDFQKRQSNNSQAES